MLNLFTNLKNSLSSGGVKIAMNMNPQINRIAEVLDLKIEPGKISLTALLKGENEPITLSFKYVLQNDDLCISGVTANKEWLRGLAGIFEEQYAKIDLKTIMENKCLRGIIKGILG